MGPPDGRFACPCCGSLTLSGEPPGTFELCKVCDWEDDSVQFEDPAYRGGANVMALDEARAHYVLGRAASDDAVTLAASDGARACSVAFFLAGRDDIVRYEIAEDGRHLLEPADDAVVRAHLDEIVQAVGDATAGRTSPVEATHEQVSDATRLAARGDDAGARAALPQAPGYVAALGDVRLAATVAVHARGGDIIETTSVGIVHSPTHGLWMLEAGDDELTIEQVSAAALALRLEALLDVVAAR